MTRTAAAACGALLAAAALGSAAAPAASAAACPPGNVCAYDSNGTMRSFGASYENRFIAFDHPKQALHNNYTNRVVYSWNWYGLAPNVCLNPGQVYFGTSLAIYVGVSWSRC